MTHNEPGRDRDRDRAVPPPVLRRRWTPWIIGAGILLLLLLLLSRCGHRSEPGAAIPTADATSMPMGAPTATAPSGISGLDAYLAGSDAAPRTFAFERVHFDTGSSAIRAEDRPEIAAVADALKRHASAQVKLYGYADATGGSAPNATLGQARADVVRAALTAAGVDARRIEAVSGGEEHPIESNATSAGKAENRRTELVVVQR